MSLDLSDTLVVWVSSTALYVIEEIYTCFLENYRLRTGILPWRSIDRKCSRMRMYRYRMGWRIHLYVQCLN